VAEDIGLLRFEDAEHMVWLGVEGVAQKRQAGQHPKDVDLEMGRICDFSVVGAGGTE
jgi:hypothetical protein